MQLHRLFGLRTCSHCASTTSWSSSPLQSVSREASQATVSSRYIHTYITVHIYIIYATVYCADIFKVVTMHLFEYQQRVYVCMYIYTLCTCVCMYCVY